MLHDHDLHELRSAVLLYHVQNQHMIQFAVLALIILQLFWHLCQTFFDLLHHLYLPLEDLVDFEKEKGRLLKEQARLEKELARSKGMLSNEKFLSKAPEAKVQEEKDKLAGYEQMMEQVKERLAQMSK